MWKKSTASMLVGLRAQELPPTRIDPSRWRWWDPAVAQDPADR
jgi:hypothetical protein